MSDHGSSHDKTVIRETRVERSGGNGPMAFILGAVVVALGIVGWVVFGDADISLGGGGGSGGGDTTVNIDASGSGGGTPAPEGAAPGAATDG